MVKFCNKCGKKNQDDVDFCINCGANIKNLEKLKDNNISYNSENPYITLYREDDKSNTLAIILSIIFPGLGFLYLGDLIRFAVYIVLAIILLMSLMFNNSMIGFYYIIYIYQIYATYDYSKRLHKKRLVDYYLSKH